MTNKELLTRVGKEVLGWEFLETTASLPEPSDALREALAGTRGPIFWCCDTKGGESFLWFAAELGEKAQPWNPLEKPDHLQRVLAAAESRTGERVAVHDGDTPREACKAALAAVSTDSLDG